MITFKAQYDLICVKSTVKSKPTNLPGRMSYKASIRHHLSHDDCVEDKRKNYQNCSVLCCIRPLCTVIHTHEQFVNMTVGLGLDLVCFVFFRFSILCAFCFSLDYFVLVLFTFLVFGLVYSVLCQEIGSKERL